MSSASTQAPFTRTWRVPPGETRRGSAPPTFSVIIAAYQAAGMIGGAVDSALSQTVAPHEIVVSDDGSTDDLAGALREYGDRVRLLRNPHGGEGAAKNAAARASTGEFVVILDADDAFLPERIEALGELAAARPDLDLLTTDAWYEVDGRRTRRAYRDVVFPERDQRAIMLRDNFVFGAAAIRRSALLAIGGFDPSVGHVADWHCWLRLMLNGARAGLVDEPLYLYRIHPASMSAERSVHLRARVEVLERIAAEWPLEEQDRAAIAESIRHHDRRARLAEAQTAVRVGSPQARRLAAAVARDAAYPPATRAKAALAAALPAVARSRRRGREVDPRAA